MENEWTPPSDGVAVGLSFVPPSDAVKKKDLTASGSVEPSSERLTTTTTKATVSSSSKGEIFTGYPGKEEKPYQFKDGKWYEEAPVKVYGQKAQYVQIQDPNRIGNLNKQFKKDVSLSQQEEVFNNYDDEKSDNQYRIKDGQWQRMTPGSKWHTIQNEGSINALNNRYGKSVSTRVATTTTVKPVKFDDINSDFMAKTEEDAIKKLTEKYGKLGFEFSEEGLFLKDQIRVKTKDGSKELLVEFDEKNPEQARELRAFLEVNASKLYSENFDKALNSLNKFEGKDQMSGPKMGTGQYGYQQQSAIVRGKNLLSSEFQSEFKKLPFEEQKEIIKEQIIGTGLPTNDVQSFYKSAAYQDYKKKKVGGDQQTKANQDQIYDDYKYALATKDPVKIKEAKAKINAYYTDEIIQDNVKTYNMQLNDFEQSQKNILQDRKAYDEEVSRFNELAKSGKMTQEQYDAQKKILDNQAESLETRAQNFLMQKKEIQASQNKLNLVAGKYVAAKEKEGSLSGFLVNKVLSGVSMTFVEPFAALEATGQNFYNQLSPEEKAYYKSIQHNGKNLTREQIENLLANKAMLRAKNEAKESIIKTLGSEGTTLEYMKSGDRGFITQAIGGVLESLPAMATGMAGKAVGFTGLALQAYSGIEEEMLSDPDFQYTSAGDRAIIAIPYAAGMGVLENVGLQNLVKGDSFLGKVMMDVAIKSAKKLGANATKEALERVAAKEVESLLAKGLIRVTQAGVAEFETGFTQALVLDQGLKQAYNWIQQSGMTEEQRKNLTQGEYFDTADSLEELGSKTFEDGVAEMIGGFTMGSVGTVLQAVVNGNISLYNEDDVKFLKDVVADSNFKKLYVASMKTQMLDGKITKSKAQQNLDNLNEIEAAFDMMPDNLSTADMNRSLSLITERAQLTKEKAGKDPNLVAPLEARIKAINEELTKIGENAVQEQATSKVPLQPGAAVSGEVAQGKPEAGLKETAQKGKEEVDQYIADMGAEARIGNTINPVMEKMANAEYINDNDIDNAIEAIFNEVESLDKSDYSAETKAALSEKLLNIAEKLDNYEFRTKNETVATTKAGAATTTRRTSEAVQKIRAEKYFDGVQATVNGQEVTLKDNKGRVEAQMPNGEVVVLDTPTMEIAENGIEFDDSDALVAVTVTDRLGNTARLTGNQALDFAIRDRENKLGVVEQAEFDTVYQEVEKKYIKETLATQVAAEEAVAEEQQPAVEEEAVVEEEKQPITEPSEANRFTERNAKVMAVKFPSKKGIVKAALNVIKALPGVKIYLHEDSNQYAQELASRTGETKQSIESEDSAGSYIDGEIHLDMSRADVVTLLHEAFHHAFLTLGVKNGMFIDLAKGLRSLVTDKKTLAELDEFVANYSEETAELQAEEFATQLGAILANNREELTTTKLTQFKALINRIAKKIGLGMVFSAAANRKEAADFINTITRGLTTGDIVEGKLQPGKTGKAKRQAVTVMEGKESMKKFGLSPGRNITRKIGEALEARQRAKYGTIAQKDNSPEARKKISNWMVDEVKYFVQLMGDKSGKGWYGELYQNSLDAMSKIFPEMKTDQNARDLFTMLVAITSDGEKVMSNFRLASEAYDYYKKNGVMPDTLSGHRPTSFGANLKRINNLLTEYNGDIAAIKKDLMDVRSIQDINKERKAEGLPPLKTSWPVSFKAPFAASLFGAKLGMFYSNLSGNEAYPTLDRWWSRTFNRYRGTLIPALKSGFTKKGEAIGLDRFKSLLGNPGMSNEEALLAAKSYRDSYAAKEYKNGTEIEKAANTIYKTAFENINDAPFNGSDRKFMYDTISDAVNKLNKDGYELSIADVQAILWYFEKNLYKTLGVQAKIEGISYEDAANYTYDKWKESGQKFNYEIKAEEEGQAVEDADEDIQEEIIQRKKQLKTKENNKKLPNLAQNEKGNIQSERTGDGRTARPAISKNAPLEGAPTIQGATGPDPGLVSVAEKYADENDIDLKRQGEYVELDEQRAKRIADAYEQMADDPQNPKVKEAYAELIKQTKAQYQALKDAGYKFWFVDVKNPDNIDYISSPYNAMRDLRQNKQMGVFPTEQGFGSNEDMDVSKNPLLEDTGIMWPSGGLDGEMKIVTANDLFRAVHDTFGHGLEGAGFRARGEENAWQAHSRLYTGSAIGAMTSETRGQNSWVNYGPKGEQNRTASGEDTIFADQKVGLMPKWTWTEGRAGDMEAPKRKKQLKPKILGVKPTVVIVNDEQKALVDQIKLEVRAQREQKKAYKQVLADISARVTALKSNGNISVKQFDAIMKNLKRLNFDNETKVQAFIDYVSRALANADYVEKVAKAQSINKRIKASLKGTANPFAVLAKMFTTLDPRWVQNIDDHIAVSQMIFDGVKSSTARRGVLTLKEEPDLQVIAEYIDAEQTLQTKMLLDNMKARYERITGKPAAQLDAKTMLIELQSLNPTVDQTDKIKEQIDEKLAEYADMLTDEDPQVIVDAINIDTDIMEWRDVVKILDSLDTYFTNGSLAGIEALMGTYEGLENVKKFKDKSSPISVLGIKGIGRLRFKKLVGFTAIMERKFRSQEKGLSYLKASGINDIITGANRADFEASRKQLEYMKKFGKAKGFFSNENIYERGVIADLIRTNPSIDQDVEFERLVKILMNSKDMLLESTDKTKVEMGKLYDKAFKKLGLYDANADIESVKAKANKTNVDAVNFVVDMFAEKYELLSDTAMSIYNTILGQDINYTPKTYLLSKMSKDDKFDMNDSGLSMYTNNFEMNEAGVLMPITRPDDLKDRYVDLNFDNNMFRSYRLALTDAYTAKSIRKLNSFYNSKENEDIIGSEKDYNIIRGQLSTYIKSIKGKNFVTKNEDRWANKLLDTLSTLGSVRALAGIGQFVNQFSSGMGSTIIQAGEHIRPSDFTLPAFEFMNRSGQPIANVGENDILLSLTNLDKSIKRATVGKNIAEMGIDWYAEMNGIAFQALVSNPDASARRIAWMAYYRKYAVKNKLGPIDFNAQPNADAAAYAQSMVDRSMDATDARIRGEVYTSTNDAEKLLTRMFIPFSSFGMNQRTRMWGDIEKVFTGNANLDTARSLTSIIAEQAIYNTIRFYTSKLLLIATMHLLGYDDEEQEELIKELKKNIESSAWAKSIVDTVSPLALVDDYVLKIANDLMDWANIAEPDKKKVDDFIKEENDKRKLKRLDPLTDDQEIRKREEFIIANSMRFYISDEFSFGTMGIQAEKFSEIYEMQKALRTGSYTDDRGNEKYFDDEAKEKLATVLMLKSVAMGTPIREIDQVANKAFKLLKKRGTMSEKKNDMIGELKTELGRKPKDWEKNLVINTDKKITGVVDAINFAERFANLTPVQSEEYVKVIKEYGDYDFFILQALEKNVKAEDIIKSIKETGNTRNLLD